MRRYIERRETIRRKQLTEVEFCGIMSKTRRRYCSIFAEPYDSIEVKRERNSRELHNRSKEQDFRAVV